MITVITDKRSFEDCSNLVTKVLSTQPWQEKRALMCAVNGAALGHERERLWEFRVETRDATRGREDIYICVSRDSADEPPFVFTHNPSTGKDARRHIDPVTGAWMENYVENVK